MSGHLTKYKYFCENEKKWICENKNTKPTSCKNNAEHKIKEGSLHIHSSGFCEVVPISGVTPLSEACDLSETSLLNIVEKFNLLARRVKILEDCCLLKGVMIAKKIK